MLGIALMGTFGIFLLTNYFLIYRRTLKSISTLQIGTRIIGSGNLDFSIEEEKDDEFGQLSHSFNRMTTQLKTVTASKADLEREITERKQAEEALRESEQRWATTLSSVGDAVIATDVTGRMTFMNAVAEELTGWTLIEASQKPVKEIFNIVNEHTRLEVENPVHKVLEKGMVIGLANHTILIHKDGTEVQIDDSGAPIRDPDGKTRGVVLVFRDITERKRAEEEIVSQARFPSENPNIILRVDRSGVIMYCNPAGQFLMEEWNSKVGDLVPDHLSKFIADSLASNSIIKFEDIYREQFFSFQVVPIATAGYLNVYGINVTERKKAEEKIHRQSTILDAINRVFRESLVCDTLEDVAKTCLEVAGELTDSKIGFIGEINPSGRFDNLALSGPSWDACKMPESNKWKLLTNMESRSYWGSVLKSGESRIVNDPASAPDKEGLPEGHQRITSFLGVPLKDSDRTVGMIALANKEQCYTYADCQNVEALADAFVEALNRKRAEEALRKARAELEIRVKERTAELEVINQTLESEVAAHKQAEETVRAERKQFNDVLNTLPAYLVLLTPDYHVSFANRFFRERFGESLADAASNICLGAASPARFAKRIPF